ncbi:hypothetical protein [Actinomadura sp. SCN-SB]|uniref:hypothetical protein n=1 Tax=Actinomadura sp. SCN-SB TaxID=3373092 RepID=UPI0037524DA0
MSASVSVDGFIAAENDDPGPIFEWLVSGDVPFVSGHEKLALSRSVGCDHGLCR